MKCVCNENKLQIWRGYAEVGYGCQCGRSFLPEKYYKALNYNSDFCDDSFKQRLANSISKCTEHNCPQCSHKLNSIFLDSLTFKHCKNCNGLLFSRNESIAFFEHFNIPNNDTIYSSLLLDIPVIGLLLS